MKKKILGFVMLAAICTALASGCAEGRLVPPPAPPAPPAHPAPPGR